MVGGASAKPVQSGQRSLAHNWIGVVEMFLHGGKVAIVASHDYSAMSFDRFGARSWWGRCCCSHGRPLSGQDLKNEAPRGDQKQGRPRDGHANANNNQNEQQKRPDPDVPRGLDISPHDCSVISKRVTPTAACLAT